MAVPFATDRNFLDPVLTSDGKPYAPQRFKEIIREKYIITKNTNTSYGDIGDMSPTERAYMLEFISDDFKRNAELVEQYKQKQQSRLSSINKHRL